MYVLAQASATSKMQIKPTCENISNKYTKIHKVVFPNLSLYLIYRLLTSFFFHEVY